MNIFIVGVGMGDTKYLTKIAEEKIRHMENSLCRKQQKYI